MKYETYDKLKIFLFGIAFFLVFIVCICTFNTPSTGTKIGKIVKLSEEGIFCKSWQGELIRGGFSDGSGAMGSSFQFTVDNPFLAMEIQEILENGDEVIMEYKNDLCSLRIRSELSQPNFVTSIRTNYID